MSLVSRLGLGSATLAGWALAAVMVAVVLWLSNFWTFVFSGGLAMAVIALSVGVVYGRTGMVSLCQFSFAAVGVWAMAWLNVNTSLPFLVLLGAAGLAAVPVGLIIGVLSLRLRGINLAVATLGFASATLVVLRRNSFPGTFSNQPIMRPRWFESENGYFLFCVLIFGGLVGLLALMARTRVGKGWLAVRQSERATAALGLSVTHVKLAAFSMGAFLAGIGGGLLAGQNGVVSNRSFEPFDSLLIFAVSVLAGARYVDGAIAAGLLGAVLPELFRKWGIPLDVAPMLFGVGTVAILSRGAEGAQGQLRTQWREFQAGKIQSSPQTVPGPRFAGQSANAGMGVNAADPLSTTSLCLDGVSVSYGAVRALNDVNLEITSGQVHGLVGPNGAGKSTLIDTITGFVQPTAGRIELDGIDLLGLPVHRRVQAGVRRTFQQGRTIEDMAVGEYLEFASGRRLGAEETESILSSFGCPEREQQISSVDVATRRLIEVAGCVISGAPIVLLDEPGAGLGENESRHLADRIREVPATYGCGVLLVEHDMEIIRGACDELTVLDFGEIIASGDPAVVLANEEVVAAYLGISPELAGESV